MALSEIGTASGSTTSGSVTVTLSASPAANDVILIFVTFNNVISGSHPVPAITGFTSLGSSTGSVWSRTHCLWKYAAGSEGTSLSLTHTGDVGVFQVVTGLIARGADSAQPTNIVTTADASTNTTVSIAGITTAAANSWDIVCAGYGGNNDYGSGASYSSWGLSLVEKADAQVFGGGAYYCGLGMAYVARASTGSQGATSVTQTGSDVASVIRLELKESGGGGGATVKPLAALGVG